MAATYSNLTERGVLIGGGAWAVAAILQGEGRDNG